jgi:hypothetical protein
LRSSWALSSSSSAGSSSIAFATAAIEVAGGTSTSAQCSGGSVPCRSGPTPKTARLRPTSAAAMIFGTYMVVACGRPLSTAHRAQKLLVLARATLVITRP